VLGKVNATLEAKWNKVLANGVPKPKGAVKAAKLPKAKLPDPTPALDAVLPPSFKAIVTPPSRRTDADKVVYDDTLGAVVKVSEQAALRAEFEANRAATAAAEAEAEKARAAADAEIAKTNEELVAKAKEAEEEKEAAAGEVKAKAEEVKAAAAAAAKAKAAVPEGKGTAAAGAPKAATATAAAKPAAAKAVTKPAAAAPVSAPAKGAGGGGVVSFKQAPARNATMPPKLEVRGGG
jgi:hypothetical protein